LRGAGRFYPQTASEAAAVPDEALPMIWACALKATTAVVRAPRGEVAAAIAQQASAWRADVIVMTRRPSPAIWRLVLGSVPDQVMRKAHCPVLAVHPGPKVTRNASR
jgi:nucleotide-binding universal stress UspA family protein